MTVTLLRGDALHLPLADHSVDLVVTSPPYFGLRSYQDGGQHYPGQIGSEATPAEWVAAMLAATAEMVRVLKPSGSIWVNLGDKYAADYKGDARRSGDVRRLKQGPPESVRRENIGHVRLKSLIGLPWRYAIACIDQLGLILRAEVIWSKPNGLPESVTDRVRRSHEQWLHFVVRPRYFSAVDEIREPHERSWGGSPNGGHTYGTMKAPGTKDANLPNALPNPLGKLPGSVWSIPSQPLTVPPELGVDHFAAFPMEWPRRLIAGWSPAGVCTGCGEGRRPVAMHAMDNATGWPGGPSIKRDDGSKGDVHRGTLGLFRNHLHTITGYTCACERVSCDHAFGTGPRCVTCGTRRGEAPPPTTPSVVLDPFGGTGTTALVAHVMGRHGISVDMSADYTRLAAWRTTDPGELAKAAQVEKPAVQTTGQTSLFEHLEGA